MYATTRQFLDYFNLKSLDQLPPLAEIKELENLSGELGLEVPESQTDEQTTVGEDGEPDDRAIEAGREDGEADIESS